MKPEVSLRVHKSPPLDTVLSQINPFHVSVCMSSHLMYFLKLCMKTTDIRSCHMFIRFTFLPLVIGTAVAQAVWCLTKGWTIGVRSPTEAEDFSSSLCVQTGSGAHTQPPVQWVPGVPSPGVKRGRGVMLTTHPHLVPRLSMSRSYISSPPMCLHGV
jgi:hypothetical protein